MRTITIAARKGGVGKTTLATHLSVLAAARASRSFLSTWTRNGRWRGGGAFVQARPRPWSSARLAIWQRSSRPRSARVSIPSLSRQPHDRQGIVDAMRMADLVVLPTRPGDFDLAAIGATLEIARQVGKPHLAVLNACPPRTGSAEQGIVTEARAALAGMGAKIADTAVSQRVALGHAIISG